MQGAVSKAAPLALPRHAAVCEWCGRPVPAYGPEECAECIAKFETCLAAERDFRTRLIAQAEVLMTAWVRDWAHHPALASAEAEELLSTFLDGLRSSDSDERDLTSVRAAFAAAWAQERGMGL